MTNKQPTPVKVVRIYGTNEIARAFWEIEKMRKEKYEGTLSYVRGRKSADIKVKIEYLKHD